MLTKRGSTGNLTPLSRIAIKRKKVVPCPLWRAISLPWQYATSTSLRISNFCLKVTKDAGVSRKKAKPISKPNIEGRNSKKETEVKGRGRKLTLGSKEGRVSGLVRKRSKGCSAESKLKKRRVKSERTF